MRMQVKLEIGHKAACRLEPTPEGFTHDWTIFVRGSEGKDISHFVEKVIFHLHESFPKPKRAIKDPPYKLDESGYGSFELKIEVCFKTKDEPRRVHFTYDLFLPLSGLPPVTSVRTEALTFTHPTEDFMKKLVKGGGVPISATNGLSQNGLSNGHPPSREEIKEPAQKNPPTISENEKIKNKIKIPKSTSKPSAAIVGMKRSPPLHEHTTTDNLPKKKKKTSEGSSSSKTKHSQGESMTTPATLPLTTEVKDLKVKFKPILPKESTEKEKKKEPGADGHKTKTSHSSKSKESKAHKSEHESKKQDTSEHKIKVKKKSEKSEKKRGEKKEKSGEKKEKSKSKKDKIEKVTIRRSSGDSWANAASSGLMSNVVAKNKALGKLLSEMSSDEDDTDLPTPFKHESTPLLSKVAHKEKGDVPVPFKRESSPITMKVLNKEKADLPAQVKCEPPSFTSKTSHKEKDNPAAPFKRESSPTLVKSTHKEDTAKKNGINSLKTKENAAHGNSENMSYADNDSEELASGPSECLELLKTSSAVENGVCGDDKAGGKKLSSKELFDLYEQITNCEDADFLQKVVDVIETTGLYTVAEKTFEFDLCSLEKTTLQQLQKCLGRR